MQLNSLFDIEYPSFRQESFKTTSIQLSILISKRASLIYVFLYVYSFIFNGYDYYTLAHIKETNLQSISLSESLTNELILLSFRLNYSKNSKRVFLSHVFFAILCIYTFTLCIDKNIQFKFKNSFYMHSFLNTQISQLK